MNRLLRTCFSLAALAALCDCSGNASAPVTNARGSAVAKDYASESTQCEGVAKNRVNLYARPDTYPMSQKEKDDAYYALFDECMRQGGWDIAKKHLDEQTYGNDDGSNASAYANLSPAAGGGNVASPFGPGVTVVDLGRPYNSGTDDSGRPTVVVVQAPSSPAPASPSVIFNASAPPVEVEKETPAPAPAPNPSPTILPPQSGAVQEPPSPPAAYMPAASPAAGQPTPAVAANAPAQPAQKAVRAKPAASDVASSSTSAYPPQNDPARQQLEQILGQ